MNDSDPRNMPAHDAVRMPLAYARPPAGLRQRQTWHGIGSVLLALGVLSAGAGFMLVTGTILANWTRMEAALRIMSFVFAATGMSFIGFAAVCIVDAIVELGGSEPPRWRWYQTFGRNRRP